MKPYLSWAKDHLYRMVIVEVQQYLTKPNHSDQSELTILLCQPMNSLLLMKTTLPWYSNLQLLPSYIYDPWLSSNMVSSLKSSSCSKTRQTNTDLYSLFVAFQPIKYNKLSSVLIVMTVDSVLWLANILFHPSSVR